MPNEPRTDPRARAWGGVGEGYYIYIYIIYYYILILASTRPEARGLGGFLFQSQSPNLQSEENQIAHRLFRAGGAGGRFFFLRGGAPLSLLRDPRVLHWHGTKLGAAHP